ncbi:tyrosine-type recombinase/integrase [Marinibactrum halimedae]|uniref:Recombinase n=1 Tax=Marinibactrum halimedae TaxID=1444977 RepID=A0AA37T1Y5_9GAMM|nr:tyrosine-type recombinase/integrase [Marinibactrum halimedae]MCD9459158.1 tyrosine-type recombinase/integrase [Marinibactrum halimedae]GLS24758.1 recombinase [Marinibactrum halimedae]
MAIRKVQSGWQVDFRPHGSEGRRIRKTFLRKREAEDYEIELKAQTNRGELSTARSDNRRLSKLIDDWYELYGYSLKDGDRRKIKLMNMCDRLKNPLARKFTGEDFLRYRKKRLQEILPRKNRTVSKNTVNHEHAYLSATYGTLIKLKNWKGTNPLAGIPKLQIDESQLTYLEENEIKKLLAELENAKNPDVLTITEICLATGARWSEAETLEAGRIRNGKVHYVNTKNSKARAVPISDELIARILHGRPRFGRLFPHTCYRAFASAVERAGLQLPEGQSTHILRHTFASHYMINDGNILKLKEILGHKTMEMTLRYAKLAPKHLVEVLDKNPFDRLLAV